MISDWAVWVEVQTFILNICKMSVVGMSVIFSLETLCPVTTGCQEIERLVVSESPATTTAKVSLVSAS